MSQVSWEESMSCAGWLITQKDDVKEKQYCKARQEENCLEMHALWQSMKRSKGSSNRVDN